MVNKVANAAVWYPWLNSLYQQLVTLYSTRSHHALLIQTVPDMGEEILLYALGRYLMCQQPRGIKSCNQCHSCHLMIAGNHPDYYVFTSDINKTNSIHIDAISQLCDRLHAHALQWH